MGFMLFSLELCLGAIFTWLAFVVTYRLHFHPLAKFPGPFWAKLSDLHAVYYSIRGESHLKIWRAHQKYGPVVRLGPNKLMFNSMQALHDIYDTKETKKSVGYTALVTTPGAENTFNCVDKSRARRKRKIIGPAFSDHAVRAFEPAITKQLDILLSQIDSGKRSDDGDHCGWTEPLNMSKLSKYFMMDIVGEFAFGQSFNLQTQETNRRLVNAVVNASKAGGVVGQYPRLKSLKPPKWLAGKNKKPSFFGEVTKRFLTERVDATERTYSDLYSYVMEKGETDPELKFGFAELLGESRLLILAGSETTAAAMAATLFYLSRYPRHYDTLVGQIRSTFESASEIRSGPKLAALAYLRACIDESMRMSPPIGGALGREVLGQGHVIDGTFVSGGCDVGVALYCLHHDEEIFPDSFTYNPERWMEMHNTPERIALQRRAFNPFSVGSRKCPAQTMAYTELSIAIAKILWEFDVQRPAGYLDRVGGGKPGAVDGRQRVDEFQLFEHFTSLHDGPYLEFKRRNGSKKEAFTAIESR